MIDSENEKPRPEDVLRTILCTRMPLHADETLVKQSAIERP